ncbi:MAG: CBS domain-containing protein [Caldilineaceae bacterium]
MLIKELMTRDVDVIDPDATLQEAARQMKAIDVGSLPVCDGNKIQGIITDRDIAIRAVADGDDPTLTKVKEVMTSNLYYCFEDQPVQEAAGTMQHYQVRRLPIVNRDRELVGMVTLGDIALYTDNQKLSGTTLEMVSEQN